MKLYISFKSVHGVSQCPCYLYLGYGFRFKAMCFNRKSIFSISYFKTDPWNYIHIKNAEKGLLTTMSAVGILPNEILHMSSLQSHFLYTCLQHIYTSGCRVQVRSDHIIFHLMFFFYYALKRYFMFYTITFCFHQKCPLFVCMSWRAFTPAMY